MLCKTMTKNFIKLLWLWLLIGAVAVGIRRLFLSFQGKEWRRETRFKLEGGVESYHQNKAYFYDTRESQNSITPVENFDREEFDWVKEFSLDPASIREKDWIISLSYSNNISLDIYNSPLTGFIIRLKSPEAFLFPSLTLVDDEREFASPWQWFKNFIIWKELINTPVLLLARNTIRTREGASPYTKSCVQFVKSRAYLDWIPIDVLDSDCSLIAFEIYPRWYDEFINWASEKLHTKLVLNGWKTTTDDADTLLELEIEKM